MFSWILVRQAAIAIFQEVQDAESMKLRLSEREA